MREAGQHILVLTLLFCGLFLVFLGAHPYITPSEARYIEIPRQMVVTGDWIVPHINGVPYFEKPPLFYWMQAAVFSVLGWGEFAGRLVTALLSVALCLLTYALGRLLYSPRTGIAAALLLATSWLGFGLSRVAMLDVPVTVCITGVLLCFLTVQIIEAGGAKRRLANNASAAPARFARDLFKAVGLKADGAPGAEGAERNLIIYGMYVAAALGVMTKGLIGAIIPGMVVFFWLLFTGRWAVLKQLRIFTGTLLFLIIVVPWHMAAAHRYPEFWQFYIMHEHFSRFLTDDHHRDQPWWFFLAVVIGGWMPWTLFVIVDCVQRLRRLAARSLRSRCSLVVATLLHDPYRLFLALWAVLPLLFFSLSHSKLLPYIYPIFPPMAVLLATHMLKLWDGKWRKVLIALAVATPLAGYAGQTIAPQLWRGSVKQVAAALLPTLKPGDEVVIYSTYRQDLPIYLNRDVTVVAYEGELAFGTSIEPKTKQWMIGTDEFWARCRSHTHHMYVFMPRAAYDTLRPPEGCRLEPAKLGAAPPERFVLLETKD